MSRQTSIRAGQAPIRVDCSDPRSKCVTRNGVYRISEVSVAPCAKESGMVDLMFVSKKLHRSLHSGATISESEMDRLAAAWLRSRRRGVEGKASSLMARLSAMADALNKELDILNRELNASGKDIP